MKLSRPDPRIVQAIEFCKAELNSPNGLDQWEAAYDAGIDSTCLRVLAILEGH